MTFKVRVYGDITKGTGNEDGFTDTKATLRGQHKAAKTNELNQPRRHQIQFIDKVIQLLDDANKNVEKSEVITGVMLLVLAIIADSYSEDIFSAIEAGPDSKAFKGSTCFRCLLINKGATKENQLTYENYRTLIAKADFFISSHVYVDGSSTKGFKPEHAFSDIEELDIGVYLKMCARVVAIAKEKIIDRNSNNERAQRILSGPGQEKKSWFSLPSSFWFSSTPQNSEGDLKNTLSPV